MPPRRPRRVPVLLIDGCGPDCLQPDRVPLEEVLSG